MPKHLPELLSILLLFGIATDRQLRPQPVDSGPFHTAVREAVAAIPMVIGQWTGHDIPVPSAAQALLRPNAIFARAYESADRHQRARLIVVQCRDPRDMIGHYPPACYTAHGWRSARDTRRITMQVGTRTIPADRYDFVLPSQDQPAEMVIDSFFILPGRGLTPDMSRVREAASDYLTRGCGAAQVQLVLDPGVSEADERAMIEELLTPLLPMIRLLQEGPAGATPP